ncbi:MAG: DUF4373 domain-containing protein [Actinobacteria bacterium]|nr:DUF4373 domain-containing protein [Actinomycetota bacterium]
MGFMPWYKRYTDMHRDPKIETILARYRGGLGSWIYDVLLDKIYDTGAAIDLRNADITATTASKFEKPVVRDGVLAYEPLTAEDLSEFITFCCTIGLFEADEWAQGFVMSNGSRSQLGTYQSKLEAQRKRQEKKRSEKMDG